MKKLLVSSTMYIKHSEFAIRAVIGYGYSREEAINILEGKNFDGSGFIELPF